MKHLIHQMWAGIDMSGANAHIDMGIVIQVGTVRASRHQPKHAITFIDLKAHINHQYRPLN